MSKITIENISKEVTAWNKEITFEREGETYVVTLYWDIHDGYDITFHNPSLFKPTWAITGYDWANTLEQALDELTEKEESNA
jgi:hypothetical protein